MSLCLLDTLKHTRQGSKTDTKVSKGWAKNRRPRKGYRRGILQIIVFFYLYGLFSAEFDQPNHWYLLVYIESIIEWPSFVVGEKKSNQTDKNFERSMDSTLKKQPRAYFGTYLTSLAKSCLCLKLTQVFLAICGGLRI